MPSATFSPGGMSIDTAIMDNGGLHCANEFAPTIEHKYFHTNRLHSMHFQLMILTDEYVEKKWEWEKPHPNKFSQK